jgi:hypothetical protein
VTEIGEGCIIAKCYKLNLNWQKERARQGLHEKCYTVVEKNKFREKGWWFWVKYVQLRDSAVKVLAADRTLSCKRKDNFFELEEHFLFHICHLKVCSTVRSYGHIALHSHFSG